MFKSNPVLQIHLDPDRERISPIVNSITVNEIAGKIAECSIVTSRKSVSFVEIWIPFELNVPAEMKR